MIDAYSVFGNKTKVDEDKFRIRVSVYGVIVHKNKILLIKVKSSDKYFYPGGEIELGETIKDALVREVWEETGVKVVVGDFIDYRESFFYYDPNEEGFQNYSFYFQCEAKTFGLTEKYQPGFDEAKDPEWVDIKK